MTWNYRVIRYKNGEGFGLHDVFYDNSGIVVMRGVEPIVSGETVADLQISLQMMLKDIERHEILNEADLPR